MAETSIPVSARNRSAAGIPRWEQALPGPIKRFMWRGRHLAHRRLRELALRPSRMETEGRREELAIRYLRGDGIEIGALFLPMAMPQRARVRYVDHAGEEELRITYARELQMHNLPLVVPDVVNSGEELGSFADASLDFVVANHVLEHVEDPIATLKTFLRVLRPAGIVFLTQPDARLMFDAPRPRTTLEHVLRDHEEGPEVSRRGHYAECARLIEGVPEERVEARAAELEAEGARIHFHVWELETFLEMLLHLDLEADIECVQRVEDEFAVVLRRR